MTNGTASRPRRRTPAALWFAVLALAGAGTLCAAPTTPVKRWSFEHDTEGWTSRESTLSWSHLKAKDRGWSLQIDVSFPEPASAHCPVAFDVDGVGEIIYHVYVPADAPDCIKTLLFLKDKDGLWFQDFREEPVRPGQWNRVSVDVAATSPRLAPSAHHRVWNSVAARGMNQIGVSFFCDRAFKGSLHLDRVIAYPAKPTREPAPLRVIGLRENSLRVRRYEKFELSFDINRHVSNPFEPDHVKIDATFLDPANKAITIPAFYHQDYVRRVVNDREHLTPVGPGMWKVRFAPMAAGTHRYYLTVTYTPNHGGKREPEQLITGKRRFECVPSDSPGFIRVSKKDPMYFEFDNGDWFYPIGHNVHSPSDDTPRAVAMQKRIGADIQPDHGTFTYDRLFKTMADSGENLAEVWLCSWWLGLEWIGEWKHYDGLTSFNMQNAWKLDYTVDLATRLGLRIHLVFDNHGKASTWCDPEWEDNPYNKMNGGFLDSPEEFFRNPIAKEIYKKKLRYIIARWGYSTHIAGLELWSEIDLVGDSWNFHANDVQAAPKVQWHREMTEYLERIDPWNHMVTTHFSTTCSRIKSTLVSIPGIDYIACDAYRGSGGITKLVLATARAFANHGKPGIVTEYGGSPFASTVPGLRADVHAGLWSTYMTHTAGSPLLWWHQFIDSDGLYWNYKALAAYHQGEDRRGKGLVSGTVSFPNGHHDLSALCLKNPRMAYLWVYSRSAMERMPEKGQEPVFENITIQIKGMAAAKFRVEVWDCYKGGRVATLTLTAANGRLLVPLPRFRNDVALKIKPAS